MSLVDLLETDCDCPRFSGTSLAADELGELLYRAARVRSVGPWPLDPESPLRTTQRPYVSVACLFELEVYLALDRVEGVPRGVHHYDARTHTLVLLDDTPSALAETVDGARIGAAEHTTPAAAVLVTARRERVDWVFGHASHAMSLVHAGALLQTLRLCAAMLGLAFHPIPVDVGRGWEAALAPRWPAEVAVGQGVLDPGPLAPRDRL